MLYRSRLYFFPHLCALVLVLLTKLHKLASVGPQLQSNISIFFSYKTAIEKSILSSRIIVYELDLTISEIGFCWSLWLVNRMAIVVSRVRNRQMSVSSASSLTVFCNEFWTLWLDRLLVAMITDIGGWKSLFSSLSATQKLWYR